MAKKIFKGIATLALGTVGGILGIGGSKKVAAPAAGPTIMPLADDEAIKAAKKRSIAAQLQRGGRGSTILTDYSSDSPASGGISGTLGG